MSKHTFTLFGAISSILIMGCANSGPSEIGVNARQTLAPICGVRINSDLILSDSQNNTNENTIKEVDILIVGKDLLQTRFKSEPSSNPFLITLEGISTSHLSQNQQRLLRETIRNYPLKLYLVDEAQPCTFNAADGSLIHVAQLVSIGKDNQWENFSETLLLLGLAKPAPTQCGDNILSDCLQAIPERELLSDQIISKVLWNPESALTGKLEILSNAYNVNISIKGNLSSRSKYNEGPSEGYNSTARFSYAGCAYGSSKVYFTDEYDRPIKLADGSNFLRINNSCEKRTFIIR